MALKDYSNDMEQCCRCSTCKYIPLEKVTEYRYTYVCPSIARYNFHTYSGSGRMALGMALLEKRLEYNDRLLETIYNCHMCGACDISCKYAMDMEVLEPINEIRINCVENGLTHPVLNKMIASLRKRRSMIIAPNAKRGEWAANLITKDFTREKAEVIYHAGCRICFDKTKWNIAQATIKLMQKATVDVGIALEESCCGGRAYQMGYKEDALNQARLNMEVIKKSGAKTLVTGCAECYQAFKVLYDKFGLKSNLEILHATEYFDQLIKEGKLTPERKVNMTVTYHDPCHLGRQGEKYINWHGKEIPGHIRIFDPPKEFRRGTYGVYQPPRNVLRSIPGITLNEMTRIKEYAWCCGAGGGVRERNPDFARWTANERIQEAETTGAEAIATACPGCENNFNEAITTSCSNLKVYDVVELLAKAIL